jgi:hypothetical protein
VHSCLYSERASVYRQRSSRRQTGRCQRTLNYTNRSLYCTAQSWIGVWCGVVWCAMLCIVLGYCLYPHAYFVSTCNALWSYNQAEQCSTVQCIVVLRDTVLCNVTLRLDLYYLLEGNRLVPPPLGALLENALLLFFFTGPPLGASFNTGAVTGASASASDWDDACVGFGVGGSAETGAETETAA